MDKIDGGENVIRNLRCMRAMVNIHFSHFMMFLTKCHALQRLIVTGHHSRRFSVSNSSYFESKLCIHYQYYHCLILEMVIEVVAALCGTIIVFNLQLREYKPTH